MNKPLTSLVLSAGLAGVANAHTLGPDAGVPRQLWHELLGWHHLPFTLLLVAIGVILYVSVRARDKS